MWSSEKKLQKMIKKNKISCVYKIENTIFALPNEGKCKFIESFET